VCADSQRDSRAGKGDSQYSLGKILLPRENSKHQIKKGRWDCVARKDEDEGVMSEEIEPRTRSEVKRVCAQQVGGGCRRPD
jgi:hypothetical protein